MLKSIQDITDCLLDLQVEFRRGFKVDPCLGVLALRQSLLQFGLSHNLCFDLKEVRPGGERFDRQEFGDDYWLSDQDHGLLA